jgi:hypothetical protein
MEQAERYNKGKLRWSLVDFKALEPLVKVLQFGANKYDDYNWHKGLPYREVCESMMRHLLAFMQGEDFDPESRQSHLGHIMANAMFLQFYKDHFYCGKFDNRNQDITDYLKVKMEDSPMTDEIVEALECDTSCKGYKDVNQMMHELNQERSSYSNCPHVMIDSEEDIPDTTDGLKACGVSKPFATGPNEHSYIVDLDTWEGRAFLEEFNKLKKERDEQ